MINVKAITDLQQETVIRGHENEPSESCAGNEYRDALLSTVCRQHCFNYLLWHEEDIARSTEVGDARVAAAKRAIDRYNQKRNDWIEKIDDWITEQLAERKIIASDDAPLNTETPGSAIDRLSILALRIYHLEEQLQRDDVDGNHMESVRRKIAIARVQHDDLSQSLSDLLEDIFAGCKRHRTYRQMKMYNDPALNPYLYKAKRRLAG